MLKPSWIQTYLKYFINLFGNLTDSVNFVILAIILFVATGCSVSGSVQDLASSTQEDVSEKLKPILNPVKPELSASETVVTATGVVFSASIGEITHTQVLSNGVQFSAVIQSEVSYE